MYIYLFNYILYTIFDKINRKFDFFQIFINFLSKI
nr:MAG TPA: hypothetical protein [Caudoviricetes sp.]